MTENKITEQPQAEGMALVTSDRKISVPVKNQLGEQIGVFRFDPTDIGMVTRYEEISGKFDTMLKELTDSGPDADPITQLKAAGDKIIDAMDYILGGNSREAFFSTTHPLSPVNGRFYCEEVFEIVGAFIAKRFEAESKRIDKRISAQTHGYRTGKHKKGDR